MATKLLLELVELTFTSASERKRLVSPAEDSLPFSLVLIRDSVEKDLKSDEESINLPRTTFP